MKCYKVSIYSVCCVLLMINICMAWNEETTHNTLTSAATNNSTIGKNNGEYLTNILGFSNGLSNNLKSDSTATELSIARWLTEGAKLEDEGKWYQTIFTNVVRPFNHFHNPLLSWSSAGLNDVKAGESSLLWAQDATLQATKLGGDWTWNTIRNYYYTALTATSDTTRQEYFARTFKGVGHQMHLVQDTSVPAHVRNDSHAQDALGWRQSDNLNMRLETWAKGNAGKISEYADKFSTTPSAYYPTVSLNVPISGKVPITQLIDADVYTGTAPSATLAQGLAEYTNANFPSEYTLFAENKATNDPHYFPYPRASGTDLQDLINEQKLPETVIAADQIPDTSFWISKTGDGEVINHFVRPGYLSDNLMAGDAQLFRRSFYIDETCFSDYTEKLIPRAVGYSHSLTNVYLAFNGTNASVANHSATIANIPPGNYGRVFVIGEYLSLPVSVDVTLQIPNVQDTFPHSAFTTFVEPIEALDNQHFYPIMFDVRGITSWWYSYYTNAPYPGNSTCDFTTASPNIVGPVAVTIP